MNIKDHVKGKVYFQYYQSGYLWYKTDSGLIFPVPVEDTGDGRYLAEDKGMMFMRYIRKHLNELEKDEDKYQE